MSTSPTITIDGRECAFEQGQTILQVANAHDIAIPQYCFHDGLSIVASCRICLAEVWAPNPRNDNKLEAIPKLLPTCQTPASEGQVVYTDSPKAIANQKQVMEYLLINHPLDCPVCDQAGECLLQDFSYEYGRGVSRFEETKVKQPKKNLGPNVLLYSDRCIMCSRCVRFTREVAGTGELIVEGRGNQEQIDIFPGMALDNPLASNVIDLCPVGALLDKDFLFTQRVWFLESTPSVDGITAQGDNIYIEHNKGSVYRIKPRANMDINKWWISDEIRYGYEFVHDVSRITTPRDKGVGGLQRDADWSRAYREALKGLSAAVGSGKGLLLMVSPMLSCEDAYTLALAARAIDSNATLAVGPVPFDGEDRTFPGGYTLLAEKAPNARGVRRVLEAIAGAGNVPSYDDVLGRVQGNEFGGLILTGNYPSEWVSDELAAGVSGAFTVLIDTMPNKLTESVDVFMPGATWTEKAGSFENATNTLQAFEQAIPTVGLARAEAQIGLDLHAIITGSVDPGDAQETIVSYPDAMPGQVPEAMETAAPIGPLANAADLRMQMAEYAESLARFTADIAAPAAETKVEADMQMVSL